MIFMRLQEFLRCNQKEKAEAMDVTQGMVSMYSRGGKTMGIDKLYKLCKHYGVSSDYLLGLSDLRNEE